MSSLLLLTIIAVLFILGLAGAVIPGLPGIGLIFFGILIYAIATSFSIITPLRLLLFALASGLALAVHYAGSMLGARAGGGGTLATVGAIAGALFGTVTFGPLGLFMGAFAGALIGALYEGRSGAIAAKAAVYSLVGIIGGSLLQVIIGLGLIIAFLLLVL